jgi:phosphoglycolate phosphatase
MKKECSLIFDLDGTLWDAVSPITAAWNQAMAEEKAPFLFDEAKIKSYMGLTPEETCPLAFPGVPFEEEMRLFQACLRSEIAYLSKNPGKLYPKEREVLAELSKTYSLYLVSNSDKGYVENYLTACQMSAFFSGHVCAGDTGLAKWANIQYLMKRENLAKALYIGDTAKDKNETEKAGIPFIHAAYGFGEIPHCRYRLSRLADLPLVAAEVFRNNL